MSEAYCADTWSDWMATYRSIALFIAYAAVLIGCSSDNGDKPYFEFAGGGFIYNYRLATADYGFVVKVLRKLPEGAVIEAEFEDPAGGPPIVIREVVRAGRRYYKFETPPVKGIRAGNDYRTEVRLIEVGTHRVIARYTKSFHADIDQSILPDVPSVIGPGYQRNPDVE